MALNTPFPQKIATANTAAVQARTGEAGELYLDTDRSTLVAMTGAKAGGVSMAPDFRKIKSASTELKVNGGESADLSSDITLTLDASGFGVTLSDAIDSDSSTTAASSKAVKDALATANVSMQGMFALLNSVDERLDTDLEALAEKVNNMNDASGVAGEAKTTAEAAQATANEAKATADGIADTANTAKTTADAASTAASAAQTTADAAKTAASTAQTTADNAASAASTAQTTATNAQTAATNAANAASTAQTTANTAKTTADNAASAASTAQTTANTAKSTADSAASAASTAQTTANTANTTANAAKTTAEAAIPKSGARGSLAGYETVTTLSSNTITISQTSGDVNYRTGSGTFTVKFTASANAWTKILLLRASAASTLSVSGATWVNKGSAPTWGNSGTYLMLVAQCINSVVYLSVAHNSQ